MTGKQWKSQDALSSCAPHQHVSPKAPHSGHRGNSGNRSASRSPYRLCAVLAFLRNAREHVSQYSKQSHFAQAKVASTSVQCKQAFASAAPEGASGAGASTSSAGSAAAEAASTAPEGASGAGASTSSAGSTAAEAASSILALKWAPQRSPIFRARFSQPATEHKPPPCLQQNLDFPLRSCWHGSPFFRNASHLRAIGVAKGRIPN